MQFDLVQDFDAAPGDREFECKTGFDVEDKYNELDLAVAYQYTISKGFGISVEVPVSLYAGKRSALADSTTPNSKIRGMKLGLQYNVAVIPEAQLSMAVAFTEECHLHSFKSIKARGRVMECNTGEAMLIVAKRWGRRIHSMFSAGQEWTMASGEKTERAFNGDASMHYQVSARHLIGVEYAYRRAMIPESVLYPQIKIALNKFAELGVGAGIPTGRSTEGITFLANLEIKL